MLFFLASINYIIVIFDDYRHGYRPLIKKVRKRRKNKKQTGGWLNRHDFAYAGRDTMNQAVKDLDHRVPIILKKVSGVAGKVLQRKIS